MNGIANRTKTAPLEIEVQTSIVQAIRYCVKPADVAAVPNSTGDLSRAMRGKLKAEGRKRGVPDLLVAWPGGSGWIEVKRPGYTARDVRPDQSELHARWSSWGLNVGIATSVEGALDLLRSWGAPVNVAPDLSRVGHGDAVDIFGAL